MSDVYDGRMECLVCHVEKTMGELYAGVCGPCCERRCLTCANSLFAHRRLYCANYDEIVQPMHTCDAFVGRSTMPELPWIATTAPEDGAGAPR